MDHSHGEPLKQGPEEVRFVLRNQVPVDGVNWKGSHGLLKYRQGRPTTAWS